MSQQLKDGYWFGEDNDHCKLVCAVRSGRWAWHKEQLDSTSLNWPVGDGFTPLRRIATLDGTPVVDEGVIEAIVRGLIASMEENLGDHVLAVELQSILRKHLCTEKREASGEDVSEKPGDSAIESNDAVTRHHRIAAHNYGELFCWCVKNLKKFPPRPGVEWVDDVKERLLERDQLQARIAELEQSTNRYRRNATGDEFLLLGDADINGNPWVMRVRDRRVICWGRENFLDDFTPIAAPTPTTPQPIVNLPGAFVCWDKRGQPHTAWRDDKGVRVVGHDGKFCGHMSHEVFDHGFTTTPPTALPPEHEKLVEPLANGLGAPAEEVRRVLAGVEG